MNDNCLTYILCQEEKTGKVSFPEMEPEPTNSQEQHGHISREHSKGRVNTGGSKLIHSVFQSSIHFSFYTHNIKILSDNFSCNDLNNESYTTCTFSSILNFLISEPPRETLKWKMSMLPSRRPLSLWRSEMRMSWSRLRRRK